MNQIISRLNPKTLLIVNSIKVCLWRLKMILFVIFLAFRRKFERSSFNLDIHFTKTELTMEFRLSRNIILTAWLVIFYWYKQLVLHLLAYPFNFFSKVIIYVAKKLEQPFSNYFFISPFSCFYSFNSFN